MEKNNSNFSGCLYYSANALGRVLNKMAEEEFASLGIAPSYGFLMMSVIVKPGIQPTEISEQMQLTPSTVTRLIEKMEYKGLIERKHEGRSTHVHPTKEGRKIEKRIQLAWKNLGDRYSGEIGIGKSKKLTEAVYEAAKILEVKMSTPQ